MHPVCLYFSKGSGETRKIELAGRHECIEPHVDIQVDAVDVSRCFRAKKGETHGDIAWRRNRPAEIAPLFSWCDRSYKQEMRVSLTQG